MTEQENHFYHVAVVGAGPAGLYAARELAAQGVHVVLFNRDFKPGGLAEYGIYPTKQKMKEGLRNQFRQILSLDALEYYGNVLVGQGDDFSLDDLRAMGFQAILVTVGAQSTKWLGLPGESRKGVYHAKDIVYHYNLLPPFSQKPYQIGRNVAVVGVGNVMTDIARWLIQDCQVDSVIAVARRGPSEIKFDRKELENIVASIRMDELYAELKRISSVMQAAQQDPVMFSAMIRGVAAKVAAPTSPTSFCLRFLSSPTQILGDENGQVCGLEVEENTLELGKDGEMRARGTGIRDVLAVDTVIFAIGDQVDGRIGLPFDKGGFAKNPNPRFPIDGASYEAYDPQTQTPISDVFFAGWARNPSTGLVGIARKDGASAARAIFQYLDSIPVSNEDVSEHVRLRMTQLKKPIITKVEWACIEAAERQHAQTLGQDYFKFSTNEEMLQVLEQVR